MKFFPQATSLKPYIIYLSAERKKILNSVFLEKIEKKRVRSHTDVKKLDK